MRGAGHGIVGGIRGRDGVVVAVRRLIDRLIGTLADFCLVGSWSDRLRWVRGPRLAKLERKGGEWHVVVWWIEKEGRGRIVFREVISMRDYGWIVGGWRVS